MDPGLVWIAAEMEASNRRTMHENFEAPAHSEQEEIHSDAVAATRLDTATSKDMVIAILMDVSKWCGFRATVEAAEKAVRRLK